MVTAAVKTSRSLPALQTLKAVYDGKAKTVDLHWTYKNAGRYYFVLYRAGGNNVLTKFHTVGADQDHFTDGALSQGALAGPGNMRYAIQVVFTDESRRTRVSEPVMVNIE
jgi:hypothetical protein